MTYFGFLARFLGVPLLILGVLTWWDARRGRRLPPGLRLLPPGLTLLAHVVAAVVWTTPWDNYLVATGVWSYDRALVTGLTIGWVPIEEYAFFVLQTLMTGLWLLWLARRMHPAASPGTARPRLNRWAAVAAAGLCLAALALLLSGWEPITYLALAVGWLSIPLIPQMLVGADVLWRHRRLVAAALLPPWLYLSAVDALAIGAGTWIIEPAQSTGVMIGPTLPLEEFAFFLLTNVLIVFGMVLFLGTDSGPALRFVERLGLARRPQA